MSGKPFAFFPTPYPDEILYSILCRLHLRLGSPAACQTNQLLWGRRLGENLIMPQMLDRITHRIPPEIGLTIQKLVDDHTLYPYFRPFFYEERWQKLFERLRDEDVSKRKIRHVAGVLGLNAPKIPFLRYCKDCWKEDVKTFGEAYWHRIHQLPGIIFCPKHSGPVYDSSIPVPDAVIGFFPASAQMTSRAGTSKQYSDAAAAQLLSLSMDSRWVLENSPVLGHYETIYEAYDLFLRKRGFRGFSGKTAHQLLYEELCDFYENEVLELFEAQSTGIYPWIQRLLQFPYSLMHPAYHLLLMHFLAGSAEGFFLNKCEKTLPFGAAPWPCRNYVCEYHLKDVIEHIELRCKNGIYKAVFTCPHCGMVYRRKYPVPKENQYAGQIHIADYGWKWKERLKEHFREGSTTAAMIHDLHCDYYTIKKYGVEYGFLPADQKLRKYFYCSKDMLQERTLTEQEQREKYRSRWLAAISANPHASRKELFNIEHESYLWLRKNDLVWYDANTPERKKTGIDWEKRDKKYLEMVTQAIDVLKQRPGRPCLISVNLVKRQIGIGNLHKILAVGKVPKTAAYLKQHIETREEWRKRKIYWAVQEFKKCDVQPDLNDVMAKAGLTKKWFVPIEDYALECINQIFN